MQLNLAFTDLPDHESLWEQLDEATRDAVIERLARAITKVVIDSHPGLTENNDE
ncbi:hypothetical protein [Paraburkholderia tropica]|uniref:hypothetical protein n=1 Tax=Paraburkholderia tropica TaxID=92647 RepID=UPI002AB7B173|nr:hypothetical protein [Paraburkholderia tropica]